MLSSITRDTWRLALRSPLRRSSSRNFTTSMCSAPSESIALHYRNYADRAEGLLVWVSSTSARGGTPPYLAPYFAAKAAMDSLAVSYSGELARWGVETSIVVPGVFTKDSSGILMADGR